VLHAFPQPIAVRAGDVLHLAAGHDRVTLILRPLGLAAAEARANAA
jgi:type II protein arginine methyltransferase